MSKKQRKTQYQDEERRLLERRSEREIILCSYFYAWRNEDAKAVLH
jgi:hypothetical protein